MSNIEETIQTFINLEQQPFHRFNSWKTCYNYFQKIYFQNKGDNDTAALHLGFYLASWGMYRGSTFLLQNDYKIHIEIVKMIKNYNNKNIFNFDNIAKIKDEAINYYNLNANKNSNDNNNSTDTLITKILLGTLANTPAYDRYFIKGISIYNKNNSNKIKQKFSAESIEKLNQFYTKNIKEFKKFEKNFPKMKLLDMYFWKLGFDNSIPIQNVNQIKNQLLS